MQISLLSLLSLFHQIQLSVNSVAVPFSSELGSLHTNPCTEGNGHRYLFKHVTEIYGLNEDNEPEMYNNDKGYKKRCDLKEEFLEMAAWTLNPRPNQQWGFEMTYGRRCWWAGCYDGSICEGFYANDDKDKYLAKVKVLHPVVNWLKQCARTWPQITHSTTEWVTIFQPGVVNYTSKVPTLQGLDALNVGEAWPCDSKSLFCLGMMVKHFSWDGDYIADYKKNFHQFLCRFGKGCAKRITDATKGFTDFGGECPYSLKTHIPGEEVEEEEKQNPKPRNKLNNTGTTNGAENKVGSMAAVLIFTFWCLINQQVAQHY